MRIVYDPAKNAGNRDKHGIDFEDAKAVLLDPAARVREDPNAEGEQRFVILGADALGRVLVVVYTYREPDLIRLISARRATKREQRAYAR